MSNNYFQFKAFTISQEGCAMKVCTDSCLFGAWVANELQKDRHSYKNIIDIGTGTGLLALMLAQKIDASILGVEIDETAAITASQNVANASFSNQVNIVQQDILELQQRNYFDCVISNPPFYEGSLLSENNAVNQARHQEGLTIEQLAKQCDLLSTANATVALLAPFNREEAFIDAMAHHRFFIKKLCRVRNQTNKPYIRTMFLFTRETTDAVETTITIKEENGNYSKDFSSMLQDYYLAF